MKRKSNNISLLFILDLLNKTCISLSIINDFYFYAEKFFNFSNKEMY